MKSMAREVSPSLREVEPSRRAECAMDDIAIAKREWAKRNRRPSALTAREALMVLEFESTLVCVAAGNVATGVGLTQADRDRLALAKQRISAIVDEVTG